MHGSLSPVGSQMGSVWMSSRRRRDAGLRRLDAGIRRLDAGLRSLGDCVVPWPCKLTVRNRCVVRDGLLTWMGNLILWEERLFCATAPVVFMLAGRYIALMARKETLSKVFIDLGLVLKHLMDKADMAVKGNVALAGRVCDYLHLLPVCKGNTAQDSGSGEHRHDAEEQILGLGCFDRLRGRLDSWNTAD